MIIQAKLQQIKQETPDAHSFVFNRPEGFDYTAGQYNRWRIDHPNSDNRGITRPFTISASPTEEVLMFTTKFLPDGGSSFKKNLLTLAPGAEITIDGPNGAFTLPSNPNQQVVFLGGGVGITPFRSMIKFATDRKLVTPLTLIYANKTPADIIFRQEFETWVQENPNFKLFLIVDTPDEGWRGEVGRLNAGIIQKFVPDLKPPLYYICGPEGMINAYKEVLYGLGLTDENIRTENFTGY